MDGRIILRGHWGLRSSFSQKDQTSRFAHQPLLIATSELWNQDLLDRLLSSFPHWGFHMGVLPCLGKEKFYRSQDNSRV